MEESRQFHIPMSDGVKLSTYVQFPDDKGPWPVIFSRSPYPNLLPFWKEKAKFWAAHGYAFVVQECRGTGASEGEWIPFVHEMKDGLESLDWIISQSWMDGNIATYGASYSGVVQWCMAEHLPPEVKTMFISVTGIERYRQNYMNGMFRHDIYTVWALGNAGIAPLSQAGGLYQEALKIRPHIDMDTRLYDQQLPWYRDWVTQVDSDSPYWSSGLWAYLKDVPKKIKIPIMMVAGWFDHNLDASIQSYNKLPEAVRKESAFIIGPWIHTEHVSGDMEYPNHDVFGPNQYKASLDWFNHHLKGEKYEHLKGSVQTYTIREGAWKSWDGWIQASERKGYYLTVDQGRENGLTLRKPEASDSVTFDYNPNNPIPTKGGAALMAYLTGAKDASRPASVRQDKPGTRQDIISFLSEPLTEDIRIAGSIRAHLFVSTDAEDTSFTVCIMEVFPDGASYNIRDGITSLHYRNNAARPCPYRPNDIVEVEIELWPITWTIR